MRHKILDLGLEPLGAAFRSTSEAYIAGVEALAGASLPPAYRAFLARFGVATFADSVAVELPDGSLADVHVFLGNDPDDAYDLRQNLLSLRESHIDAALLPFAIDPLGNLFCLTLEPKNFGAVRFVDMSTDAAPWVAPNFSVFLDALGRVP